MAVRLPRSLTGKWAELARERSALLARLEEVDAGLASVVYALKVLDPRWSPPKRVPRTQTRATPLPRGAVAEACLQFLRQRQELSTPELADLIAVKYKLRFTEKRREEDFASSVAMALRRYERAGVMLVVGRDERTGALRWRLRTGADGRMRVAGPHERENAPLTQRSGAVSSQGSSET